MHVFMYECRFYPSKHRRRERSRSRIDNIMYEHLFVINNILGGSTIYILLFNNNNMTYVYYLCICILARVVSR